MLKTADADKIYKFSLTLKFETQEELEKMFSEINERYFSEKNCVLEVSDSGDFTTPLSIESPDSPTLYVNIYE